MTVGVADYGFAVMPEIRRLVLAFVDRNNSIGVSDLVYADSLQLRVIA